MTRAFGETQVAPASKGYLSQDPRPLSASIISETLSHHIRHSFSLWPVRMSSVSLGHLYRYGPSGGV